MLQDHVRYMVDCTKKMIKALRCSIETGDDEVEISSYLKRLAGDIISRTEFDCSYEKGTQISHLLNLLQQLTAQSSRHLWFPGSRWGYPHQIYALISSWSWASFFISFFFLFFAWSILSTTGMLVIVGEYLDMGTHFNSSGAVWFLQLALFIACISKTYTIEYLLDWCGCWQIFI